MSKWVALLRGVNVGGGNKVPMADLRALAITLGWRDAATYIASGNLVFSAEGEAEVLASNLRQLVAARLGVDVPVAVLCEKRLRADLNACPFQPKEPKNLHLFFLFGDANLDNELLEEFRAPSESLMVIGRTAYFHTPEGYGKSRLAERMAKVLGCDFTARNLRTIGKLLKMLDHGDEGQRKTANS